MKTPPFLGGRKKGRAFCFEYSKMAADLQDFLEKNPSGF
jgi:hypothetical protein